MGRYDEEPVEVTTMQALVAGFGVLAIAVIVGAVLYGTMQLWFWLERVTS